MGGGARRGGRLWPLLAALLLASAGGWAWFHSRPAVNAHPRVDPSVSWTVPGELVVQFRDGVGEPAMLALARRLGASLHPGGPGGGASAIRVLTLSPAAAAGALAFLRSDPSVVAAEPQRLFRIPAGEHGLAVPRAAGVRELPGRGRWRPNDPRYDEQWNFRRIDVEDAWAGSRGRGVTVAVIDTGVAFEDYGGAHRARDLRQTRFVLPYDFVRRGVHPDDDNGHGTHVAGTIAQSTDNGEGVAGIAFEASVMPLKALDGSGAGRMSDVAAAIRYAADNGARVINLSLGSPFPDRITRNACQYARQRGVTIVAAAGNSGAEGVSYPAAYPECIAVSAVGPSGELAPYSSWGEPVALAAPGGDTSSDASGGILQNTVLDGKDDYYAFQGTSMAAPHVAGVAALIVAQGVRDPAEVRAALERSARPKEPRNRYGAGELNAGIAVRAALAGADSQRRQTLLLALIWVGAAVAGVLRGRPAWGAALAATLGLLLPDVVGLFAGVGSPWNVLGHSVLIPGFFYLSEAETPAEKRFFALMAGGVAVHLLIDLASGGAPAMGVPAAALLPWFWVNALIGLCLLLAGRRVR